MFRRIIIGVFAAGVICGILIVERVPIRRMAAKAEQKIERAVGKIISAVK